MAFKVSLLTGGLWFLLSMTSLFGQEDQLVANNLDLESQIIEAQKAYLMGNYDKAATQLDELVRKNPKNDAIAYLNAQVLKEKEDITGALREINRAIKLSPEETWYAVTKGELLEQGGRYEEAASLYSDLASRDPGNEEYYVQWAYFLIKDGRPEEAINVYDTLEKNLGPSSESSRRKYMLYRGMGRHTEAAAVLEAVIERQPTNTEVMYMLAELYGENGDTDRAIQWFERILTLHPGEDQARIALIQLRSPEGDDGELLSGLARVFADPKADLDQKIKAILPHIQEFADNRNPDLGNRLESLITTLDQAHPNEAKVASIFGDIYYYRGNLDKALEAYKKAIQGEKRIYALWEQLLLTCSETRQYAIQVEYAENALDYFPNRGRLHYYLIEGLLETGAGKKGNDAMKMAKLVNRNDGYTRYHLLILEARIAAETGNLPLAETSFQEALELNPKGIEVAAWRGLLSKDARISCAAAREAANIESTSPLVRYALAHCHVLNTEADQALAILQILVDLPYPHPKWMESMGDAYALQGNANEAMAWWKQALESGRKTESLEKKISTGSYLK
jgi:tetratricopeptide (TPR) repeat protein